MRKRTTFPDSVRRLAKEHGITMREALATYNTNIRAKQRATTPDMVEYAIGIDNSIKQFRNTKQS